MNNNDEVVITQLADDTSLFLRNENSITNVLTLLDHFSRCAGLRLNKEKTYALPLGKINNMDMKKFKFKMVEKHTKVLGIYIGKDELSSTSATLNDKLINLRNLLNMWKMRNLSIKGKITLLRTKALPIMLYPASLLFIPEEIIKEVDKMFYDFIWPNKKHHVKKDLLKQQIEYGGLKMPCFKTMIKSIKMKWIQILATKQNNYTKVAMKCIKTKDIALLINSKQNVSDLNITPSKFYCQVLKYWNEIHITEPHTPNEILNESLWHNNFIKIDQKIICLKSLKQKGINIVHDILKPDGTFKNVEELEVNLNKTSDIMHLNSLKSAISKDWIKKLKSNKQISFTKIDSYNKIRIESKLKNIAETRNKDFYWQFLGQFKDKATAITTWETFYPNEIFDWKEIFKLPYKSATESHLQSMQYKIIHRYFPCGSSLNKWYKTNENVCMLCGMNETIEHYFYECDYMTRFWTAFRKWWKNIYECDISFKVVDILFGLPNDTTDVMFECLNFCILLAKQFIIDVHRMETRNSKDISFYEYLYRLKNRIKVEKHIALCKDKLSIFEKKWNLIDENL